MVKSRIYRLKAVKLYKNIFNITFTHRYNSIIYYYILLHIIFLYYNYIFILLLVIVDIFILLKLIILNYSYKKHFH